MGIIYIITEGENDKAQYLFWEYINKYVYAQKLVIIAANGVGNIRDKFNTINCNIKKGDIVLINIDAPKYNASTNNDRIRIIKDIILKYDYTELIDEVCFEDTILKFKYLKEWLYSVKFRKSSEYINSFENQLLNTYYKAGEDWKLSRHLCDMLTSKGLNVDIMSSEDLAHYILSTVSYYRSKFAVTKDLFSICWYLVYVGIVIVKINLVAVDIFIILKNSIN